MSDVSHSGLPKARSRGRPSRSAEELTVEMDPGFDPFAELPDLPPESVAGADAADPLGPAGPARAGAADGRAADAADEPSRRPGSASGDGGRPAASGDSAPGVSAPMEAAPAPGAGPAVSGSRHAPSGDGASDGPVHPTAGPGPGAATAKPGPDLHAAARLLGVPPALARLDVTVTVEVGRRRLPLAELVTGEAGSLIALDRLVDEPVDVLVNGTPFARGEIVALGDRFAVRLLALVEPGP